MTRALAASAAAALGLVAALSGCSSDPVPRTLTVQADSTAGSVVAAVAQALEAEVPGLAIQVDSSGPADVFVLTDTEEVGRIDADGPAIALARSGLVVVGRPGAVPAPTLAAALAAAQTVGIAEGDASGRLARQALAAAGTWDGLAERLVRFETTQAALDSVASRHTELAFALASDALSSTAYAVIYRLADDEAAPAVVRGVVRRGAPPEARALLAALAAPTAYRAWAAAGFRPPP